VVKVALALSKIMTMPKHTSNEAIWSSEESPCLMQANAHSPSRQNQLIWHQNWKPKSIASCVICVRPNAGLGREFPTNWALMQVTNLEQSVRLCKTKYSPHCPMASLLVCLALSLIFDSASATFTTVCTLPTQYKSLNKIYRLSHIYQIDWTQLQQYIKVYI